MRQTMVHRDKLAVVEGDLAAAQAALRALRAEFETYKVEARAHEQQVGAMCFTSCRGDAFGQGLPAAAGQRAV